MNENDSSICLADLSSKQLAFNRRSSNTANAVLEVVTGIIQSDYMEGVRQSCRSASVSCKHWAKWRHHLPPILLTASQ